MVLGQLKIENILYFFFGGQSKVAKEIRQRKRGS
jgi:hypothetical protein